MNTKTFAAVVRCTDGRLSVTGHTEGERDVTVVAHDSHNCTDVAGLVEHLDGLVGVYGWTITGVKSRVDGVWSVVR